MTMSSRNSHAANRNNALRELKFKKSLKHSQLNGGSPSEHPVSPRVSAATHGLPTQSRDGTVRSPYFLPKPPTSLGTVLAPDSSSPPQPTSSDLAYMPRQLHFLNPISPTNYLAPAPQSPRGNIDPLSAPSGFVTTFPSSSKWQSKSSPSTWQGDDEDDPGPPRKRINRGGSTYNPITIIESSPEGKRLPPTTTTSRQSRAESSDDDHLPDPLDFFSYPEKPRLIRGRRPHEAAKPTATPDSIQLNTLIMTHPGHSRHRVVTAYRLCDRDVRAATALIVDPTWECPEESGTEKDDVEDVLELHAEASLPGETSVELERLIQAHSTYPKSRVVAAYRLSNGDVTIATALVLNQYWTPPEYLTHSTVSTPPSSSVTFSASDGSGSNRRAEEKEKGKKSMIYAKRHALPTQSDSINTNKGKQSTLFGKRNNMASMMSTDKSSLARDGASSPLAPKPSKRKVPRRIVDSSDEGEYSDSGENDGIFSTNRDREVDYFDAEAVKWFNSCEPDALVELAGITRQQAETLISLRPFEDATDIRSKLSRKNKTGLSSRILDYCSEIFRGYRSVDDVLEGCEHVGEQLRKAIDRWNKQSDPSTSSSEDPTPFDNADGALELGSLPVRRSPDVEEEFISTQPSLLADTIKLKEYQLLGVNWMNLLHKNGLSCILADEMGLGKTVQVIAFLALLKERGTGGPHLIIVPSSTLENWIREFDRFAPSIEVQAYYGSQKDRIGLRSDLAARTWDVLITTYNLAQGDERDRKFFRKFEWQCCVFDEGHVLKNYGSQRYHHLMKIESNWRLLLTGTPLQNNLQELVSLMNFILPRYFTDVINNLRAIFKVKADRHLSLLSRDRVSRAKKMMTPFVLRRRKDMVLKDLPKKTERIEWCEMTLLQKSIYRETLQRSRKAVIEATGSTPPSETDTGHNNNGKKRLGGNKKLKDTSSNVLMDLRKAASHPMLFRRLFDDGIIKRMARQCMKEPEFSASNYQYIVEDMEVMTDAELQMFSLKYKSTRNFSKSADCFLDAGKISILLSMLDMYGKQGRRVLVFSQFVQILDILQSVLKYRKIKFLVLTGSTPVDVRQSLVDEFNEDDSISVFLLSTKAGGMGINLTAASVVVLFDQDFNPHNDRQAADRAYRIGQKRDVEVIKLITKSTIEEDMYRLGQTKLALDEAVAGEDAADGDGNGDEKAEKKMRTSLLSLLRDQYEKEQQESRGETTPVTNQTTDMTTDMDIENGDRETTT